MVFKVQVGPPQIAIHQAETVLVTEPDGQVNWPSKRGLYFRDTRVISAWAIYANGELWDLLNGGAIAPHASRIFLTNRAFLSEDGPIPPRTLGLMIGRQIDGGLHEDIDVTNNSRMDSVMYPDGDLVRGPKALCELQGYVYDAWLRMAEIFEELDNKRRANALRRKAAILFEKIQRSILGRGIRLLRIRALDGKKKKVLSVASNVGHCL
jgi:N-terminal domain of (some) glycogen debranching enzymes